MEMTLVEFECRGYRFALPIAAVRRVETSAQPVPLPGSPDIVLGVLNVAGEVVTVIDFHRRVGLPDMAIELAQQLLLVDIRGFFIGFIVDQVSGVTTRDTDRAPSIPNALAGAEFVDTVIRLDDGLCVICDPEKFLFSDEKILLGDALERLHHVRH
jgi:purine-binding chemotaxis protein CheW